jgi:diacylglycerol kinase family enzyme
MKATLIFNPNAGGASATSAQDIAARLNHAGFDVTFGSATSTVDSGMIVRDPGDVIVVAGGDGSLRMAAGLAAGTHTPLAVIPLGTANNIATALGLAGMSPYEVIDGLCEPARVALDVGVVRSAWGHHFFLESAGVGMFADLLRAYGPANGRSLARAVKAAAQVVPHFEPLDLQFSIDGREVSGKYILMEAMNTPYLGLRTPIAPAADPTDGLLEVALVEQQPDIGLASYVRRLAAGDPTTLPNWHVVSGKHIRLTWNGSTIHAEEDLVLPEAPDRSGLGSSVDITVVPRVLKLWLPVRRRVEGRCGEDARPVAQADSPAPLRSDGEFRAHLPRRPRRRRETSYLRT